MKKKAVIFDLDGTLLDTLEDLHQSVIYTQQLLGYPKHSLAEVRSHLGNGLKVLMEKSVPQATSKEKTQEAYLICQRYYGEHSLEKTKPYDGIMLLLEKLKQQGYAMAIVSNKPDFAVKDLNKVFFSEYISVAIGEKESAGIRKKPAPDTVLEALERLHCSVEEAVYVGDSEVDIETAANCGMDMIACTWGFRDLDQLESRGARVFAFRPEDILENLSR